MKEYLDILGLPENATFEEVKEARIELLKNFHPDLHVGNEKYSEMRTAEINEAFDELSAFFENRSIFNGEQIEKIKEIEQSFDNNQEQEGVYNSEYKVKILEQLKEKQEQKESRVYNEKKALDFLIYAISTILIVLFLIIIF
ncbi:MAG: DnaJ domain-containing protein [Clostridia bacterium]|nr:DnaJ domain-containing protein [Clostridia bacterium]